MDTALCTNLSNAQVCTDPEKAQSTSKTPAPLNGRRIHRTIRFRGLRWVILEVLFLGVLLYTFKDLRNMVFGTHDIFTGGPSDIEVMNNRKVHLHPDCSEIVEWSHVDVSNELSSYSHVARTSINLPISSDLLYFIGSGDLSHGVVRFLDSEDQDSDVASVNVMFLYDDAELAGDLKVCRLRKEDNKNGVGIFSPEWSYRSGNYHSTVVVEVTLPRAAIIKSLETDLPLFSHDVGDFRDSVTFGNISLTSSNLPIVAKYLSANWTNLRTSNSRIAGNFDSCQFIQVETSNSIIEGSFNLCHDGINPIPSILSLRTSYAPIIARIILRTTLANNTNGSFNVTTMTNSGLMNVKFESAPIDSLLFFKGNTSNGLLTADMYGTFEGNFTVNTTSLSTATVNLVNKIDPVPNGNRTRYIATNGSIPGHIEGNVNWGNTTVGKRLGAIDLSTSNAPVTLNL